MTSDRNCRKDKLRQLIVFVIKMIEEKELLYSQTLYKTEEK